MYVAKIKKIKATLLNHDKKFHIVKGTNIFKCDNCKENIYDKTKFISHINKEHIYCTICMKILLNPTSLSSHIFTIHDNKTKKSPTRKKNKIKKY